MGDKAFTTSLNTPGTCSAPRWNLYYVLKSETYRSRCISRGDLADPRCNNGHVVRMEADVLSHCRPQRAAVMVTGTNSLTEILPCLWPWDLKPANRRHRSRLGAKWTAEGKRSAPTSDAGGTSTMQYLPELPLKEEGLCDPAHQADGQAAQLNKCCVTQVAQE
jgi:hypothetical protein